MLTIFLSMIDDPEDQTKFENLYLKYEPDMLKIAYNITNNRYDSEEIVQDAFYSIVENISIIRMDNPGIKSYIFTLVTNKSIDYLRSKKSKVALEIPNNFIHPVDIEELVSGNEQYDNIIKKMASVPDRYRDVLSMNIVYGYTAKEISSMLNIKYSTVRSLLTRGIKMVQKIIQEENLEWQFLRKM